VDGDKGVEYTHKNLPLKYVSFISFVRLCYFSSICLASKFLGCMCFMLI